MQSSHSFLFLHPVITISPQSATFVTTSKPTKHISINPSSWFILEFSLGTFCVIMQVYNDMNYSLESCHHSPSIFNILCVLLFHHSPTGTPNNHSSFHCLLIVSPFLEFHKVKSFHLI